MMLNKQWLRRAVAVSAVFTMLLVAAAMPGRPADAATNKTVKLSTGAGVQLYGAKSVIHSGSIVQLADRGESGEGVQVATKAALGKMYGVVVDPNNISLTISSDSLPNPTYVATAGTYEVLVSDENGTINEGDYITMSSFDGIGMKADTEQATVFGRAAEGFNGKTNGIGQLPLKDSSGKTLKTVTFGEVPVSITIIKNPNKISTKVNIIKLLQRLGQQVAQKPVGPFRTYLSIGITAVSIFIALIVLYSGVRNSIISVGRNPLVKKSIFRALAEVILTSIIILIIGLFAVYLLLKL